MNPPAGKLILAAVLGIAAAVQAGSASASSNLGGRFSLELEYLGENYFNEEIYDLPLSDDLGTERFTDTTRYTDDTWLPGQRLELDWVRETGDTELGTRSTTGYNQERLVQEFGFRARLGARGSSRWLLSAEAGIRDEERSFVGHGDWGTDLQLRRETIHSGSLRSRIDLSWEHSRTRGDTTSFLYDFDQVEARASLYGGEAWSSTWEVYGSLGRRAVPDPAEGTYTQARGGMTWRPGGLAGSRLSVDVRLRDYEVDEEVGHDFGEVDLEFDTGLYRGEANDLDLQIRTLAADYRRADDLYYDYGQVTIYVPWKRRNGMWTLEAGPRGRLQRDFQGGNRDYAQWAARTVLDRTVGPGGFVQLALEAGYRDYAAAGGEVIELTSLSTTLLRSDFWLFEAMGIANVPLGSRVSLDLIANTSFESHPGESERIHVTFVTLSVSRAF